MGETPPLILLWGFQISHHEQGAPFLNRKKKKKSQGKNDKMCREGKVNAVTILCDGGTADNSRNAEVTGRGPPGRPPMVGTPPDGRASSRAHSPAGTAWPWCWMSCWMRPR